MTAAIIMSIWRECHIVNGNARRWWPRVLIAGGMWLLAGCAPPPDVTIIRLGIADTPRLLDPRLATDAASERVNRLLYQQLIDFDAANQPVPGIATWTVPTPTQYHFYLQPHRNHFTTGQRLTAQDVAATYRSILDPHTISPHRATLNNIVSIEVINDDECVFHLRHPDRLFPTLLGIGILPAAAIQSHHDFTHHPLGSGPLQLLAWPTAGRLQLLRRADQQRIELITVKDPNVRAMKLLRGEVDLLQNDLPPELLTWLQRQPGITIQTRRGANFSYIGLNLRDPQLIQPAIRQALAHAIDRTALLRYLLKERGYPAQALLPPTHWAGAPSLPAYAYDPARARALLAGLGYHATQPLRLHYKTSSDPHRLRLATVIQAQLALVNIQLTIQSYDWGTFFGDIKTGRFQLYGLTWVGIHSPDIFRYAFHSDSIPPTGANRGHYQSQVIDILLAQAPTATNNNQQIAYYRAIQAVLLADLPIIPLWYEDQIVAQRADIAQYQLLPHGDYDGLITVRRHSLPPAPISPAAPRK